MYAVRVVYKHVCIYCIDIYSAFGLILVGWVEGLIVCCFITLKSEFSDFSPTTQTETWLEESSQPQVWNQTVFLFNTITKCSLLSMLSCFCVIKPNTKSDAATKTQGFPHLFSVVPPVVQLRFSPQTCPAPDQPSSLTEGFKITTSNCPPVSSPEETKSACVPHFAIRLLYRLIKLQPTGKKRQISQYNRRKLVL